MTLNLSEKIKKAEQDLLLASLIFTNTSSLFKGLEKSFLNYAEAVTRAAKLYETDISEECIYPDCVSLGENKRCRSWKADLCPEPGELI